MMTQFETESVHAVRSSLREIAAELKKANMLKALELRLKMKNDWISPADAAGEIDSIMEIEP